MEEKKTGRGGFRLGSGRKKGSKVPGGYETSGIIRKRHTMRAFDDEWEIINKFASLLKHDHKEECREFVERLKS